MQDSIFRMLSLQSLRTNTMKKILIEASKALDIVVTAIPLDNAPKCVPQQVTDHLDYMSLLAYIRLTLLQ